MYLKQMKRLIFFAFRDHDGAERVLREKFDGVRHRIGDPGHPWISSSEYPRVSQSDHGLSKFRLEDDHQEDRQQAQQLVRDVLDPTEHAAAFADQLEPQHQQHDDHREALDDARATGSLQEPEHHVDTGPDDGEFEEDFPGGVAAEELEDAVSIHR